MSKIPTELTEKQFEKHIDPYLSQAKRGFTGQIPRYKLFNYILYWLHTGCQWDPLPIAIIPGSEKKRNQLQCGLLALFPLEPRWQFEKGLAAEHLDHPRRFEFV